MECPRCSGLEMEEYDADGGVLLRRCPECRSVWMDTADLTRALLHNNLPGLDTIGGRENLAEAAGTCPDDLTDLVVIESPKASGLQFAMCEVCAGVWLQGTAEDPAAGFGGEDGNALVAEVVDFFRAFAPAKTASNVRR